MGALSALVKPNGLKNCFLMPLNRETLMALPILHRFVAMKPVLSVALYPGRASVAYSMIVVSWEGL